MGDDKGSPPLERRVPGATRAAPGEAERPVLPEALLQRMQAVVSAAHAQAAEEQRLANEEEGRRDRPARPGEAGSPSPSPPPRRTQTASNGRKLPPGRALPTSAPPAWSSADDDTSPLPRFTASGAIAVPEAGGVGAPPDGNPPPDRGAPPGRAAGPDHALSRERAPKRDRHAAKRERAARREQERAAQQERARQEREHAADEARQRAADRERQLAAERERKLAAEQERELAAERERQRVEQARERAAQRERERAEELERERAEFERERAAELERQRAAELGRQRAAERARERAEQPERRPAAAAVRAPADLLEHPRTGARGAPGRRRHRPVLLVASALVVLAGGSLAFALSARSNPANGAPGRSVPVSTKAVAWVAREVSRTATVACDPATCRALEASGVEKLLVLGSATADPRHAQLVIATAAVRAEFGVSLSAAYAPSIIASFGSGSARIDIRVVAPDGPTAYQAALQNDVQNRKQAGAALLSSPRVVASASARRQMLAGQVSSQLLIVMTSLAAAHPVDILAFGDLAPGASAGIPLRSAELSESDGAAVVQNWLSILRLQKNPFLPTVMQTMRVGGKPVLLIEFAAPTPPGLLASS
jgi:hypothetical protein